MINVGLVVPYNPENERFLVVKRHKNDSFPLHWEFPGGTIENNEEAQNSVLRELKEETGLIGEIIKNGKPYESKAFGRTFIIHPFLAKVDSEEVKLSPEHTDFKWVEVDELRDLKTIGNYESLKSLEIVKEDFEVEE